MTDEFSDVKIPEGHQRVLSGRTRFGDQFLNLPKFRMEGSIEWISVRGRQFAKNYGCIIRPDIPQKRRRCPRGKVSSPGCYPETKTTIIVTNNYSPRRRRRCVICGKRSADRLYCRDCSNDVCNQAYREYSEIRRALQKGNRER